MSLIHSSENGFSFQCRLNGCTRTFKNMGTYRNHVYSLHTDAHCTSVGPGENGDEHDGNENNDSDDSNSELDEANSEFCSVH